MKQIDLPEPLLKKLILFRTMSMCTCEVTKMSIPDLETQKQRVEDLYKRLRDLHDAIHETKLQIHEESTLLQAICSKKGHVYSRYSDEDYHRPSYYYMCDICKHYRSTQPR